MSSYLDKILESTKEKVSANKTTKPYKTFRSKIGDLGETRGFIKSIKEREKAGLISVIAESKKASPSQGLIRDNYDPVLIAKSYYKNNATCMSVLTNEEFFKGSLEHLEVIREAVDIPLLRKDFIVDEYQIYESRASGADCILLIVAALDLEKMKELESIANDLGMAVLVESHNQLELDAALELNTPLMGINNRDLKTFEVSLKTSIDLVKTIKDRIPITESGIFNHEDIKLMNENHINTFLVGEAFMRQDEPGEALKELFYN